MIIKCPIIRRFVTFVLLLLVFGWTSVSISDKVSVINHQDRDSVINQSDDEIDLTENELRQNIESLRDEKSRIFQEINENDVEGQMIQFKLRHIAENGENKKVENHVKELEQATLLIRNVTDKLEDLESVLGSLSIKPNDIHKNELLGEREHLIKNLHKALKTEVNVKRNFSTISKILSKYLETEENLHFEQFLKKKIKLVLRLITTEKKIQYELNRFKILQHHDKIL